MNEPVFIRWRFNLAICIVLLAVIGLIIRIFDLSILNQKFLQHEGDERVLRLVHSPGIRGMIMDRNGYPLAISTRVFSVWANPREFLSSQKDLISLSQYLQINQSNILKKINSANKKKRSFAYLKRALSPTLAQQIKLLDIPGIYLQEEFRRFYPEGEVTAHIIGFTNIDDRGQEGLELAYNDWLSGEGGTKKVIKDRLGRVISDVALEQMQKTGQPLSLSIDRRIQYLAYKELANAVIENQATAGCAIVLDVKTGEILAMVNQPSFNPNARSIYKQESFRNRALTDTFEPGSTIKAFTVASALLSGRYHMQSVVDTSPGWMRVGHHVVKDEKNNHELTLSQILQISSNMGAAKLALSISPDLLFGVLHHVGFGEITGVQFPGEQSGMLVNEHPWRPFDIASLSFGYGLSITTMQLARAYSILANEGRKIPISLLKVDQPPEGVQVITKEVAKEVLTLLESVVAKGGTGQSANIPGYRVAGKTGTAKMTDGRNYQSHRYNASFVGIAPLSNPKLIVAVVIFDPKGRNYLGGLVAAPAFKGIMEGALRILDISRDDASA